MQLNRSISNLRVADTIMSRLNLVHGNLSKVLLHMRLKQLQLIGTEFKSKGREPGLLEDRKVC